MDSITQPVPRLDRCGSLPQRAVRVIVQSPLAELAFNDEPPIELLDELTTSCRRFTATASGLVRAAERRQFYKINDAGRVLLPLGLLNRVSSFLKSRGYHLEFSNLRKANPRLEVHTRSPGRPEPLQKAYAELIGQFEFQNNQSRLQILYDCVRYFPDATFQVLVSSHAERSQVVAYLAPRVTGSVRSNDGKRFFGRQPRVIATLVCQAQPYLCDIIVFFDANNALSKTSEPSLRGTAAVMAFRSKASGKSLPSQRPPDVRSDVDNLVTFHNLTGVEYHEPTQPIFAFRRAGVLLSRRKEIEIESRVGPVIYREVPPLTVGQVLTFVCNTGPGRGRERNGFQVREQELWKNPDRHDLIGRIAEDLANGCHVSATPDREVRVDKDERRSLCVVVDSVCHAAALADHLEGWRVLSAVGERFPRNSSGSRWTYDRCVLTTRRLEEAIKREGTTDRIGCDVVVWAGGGPAIPEVVQRLVTDAPGRLLVDVLDEFNTSIADESLGRIKALRSAKWTVTEASTLPTADKMSVVRR